MKQVRTLEEENTELRKRLDAETVSVRIIEGDDNLTN